MNPGNNPMNGRTGAGFRTPMGVPPKGLMGSSSGGTSCHGSLANGGPIPKLQVQPGTPLPPSTRSTPVPCYSHLDRVIEEKPQLPQIIPSNQQQTRAPPSGDPGATPHDVAIKLEPHPYVNNGYSSSCATPGAMGPPSGRPPPHSAHQLQMMAPTPTPSDMSSLPSTARRPPPAFDKAMCPASGSTCDTCMMPLHKMRDSWQTQYKVLPSLGSCSDTADHQSMPGTQESVLQSFFTEYSYSPNPSSFNSPGQSARQFSKKRAMSTSTLSSEGVDIAAIIRCSPNALGRFMGGSHGSSSNGSPQPAQPAGSITHLVDVRSNNSSPPAGSLAASTRTNMKNYAMSQSSHLQTLHCMGHLEQQGPNLQIGLPGVIEGNSNLVVQQQPDMFYMEQFLKPEPKLPNNFCENMSNETATIPPPQLTSSLRPPPPPYPGASSHHSFDIPSAYHSPLANTSINDSSPEEGDTSGQCHDDLLVEDCDKPHMCKWIDCNQLFAEQDELVRHIEKQHIDQRRGDDFTCYWQGCQRKYKPFNARYKLLIHMRVHSGEKPNKCTHIDQRRGDDFTCYWQGCQRKYKPFNARYKLLIHMRVHSIPMPNKCTHIDQRRGDDFTCYWQGCQRKYKPFNARYKLLIHMRVHSIPMPNKCTFEGCDKAFSRLENLKIHLRSHTGERPYLCQHSACPKAFSNSSDRAKHQRTHLDTYKGCNKEFTRLENLKIHLRWHTGEKPYHCQHEGCPKTFTNPSDRSKHQRTHYDPKPYGCQVPGCNKRYTDPSSLRKHVKSHDTKEQQARKKVRTGKDDVMGPPLGMMGCLAVKQMHHPNSPMDVSHNSPRPEPYPVGMQFGMAVVGDSGTSAVSESQEMAQTMGLSDNFERRIGPAGFNRNLMSHRVNMPGMANIGPISMPSLQVVKMGHQAISYSPEQTQPAQEQWPQTPLPPPVTTPSPCEAQTTTPDALQQTSRPTGILDSSSSSNNMPTYPARPYGSIIPSYDNPLHQHLQVPNHQRMPHVNIVPQAGNVPIANDYASMPCNLQERIIGQQNPHTFTMSMSVEETLANLPYDAITLSRALSNHSGSL